jgi:hypothetical protein
MKNRFFTLLAVFSLTFTLACFTGTGIAHADPNDPYDSGCSKTASVVNSGTLSVAGYVVTAQNWHSKGCNKNWAQISWNGGSKVWTLVEIFTDSGTNACYPVDCHHVYSGGNSPSWTDMIDASQDTTYVALIIRSGTLLAEHPTPDHWLPS